MIFQKTGLSRFTLLLLRRVVAVFFTLRNKAGFETNKLILVLWTWFLIIVNLCDEICILSYVFVHWKCILFSLWSMRVLFLYPSIRQRLIQLILIIKRWLTRLLPSLCRNLLYKTKYLNSTQKIYYVRLVCQHTRTLDLLSTGTCQ